MHKHIRVAKDAADAVLSPHGIRLEQRAHTKHLKFAVLDQTGVCRTFLVLSGSPRTGDTEQRNMARQQACRILVRLGIK